jgi:hypothetical protein
MMSVRIRRAAVFLAVCTLATCSITRSRDSAEPQRPPFVPRPAVSAPDTSFARLVARLSEPGGFFDSDNLISNETSYLHVLQGMQRLGVRGGAYLGVGPDQNFSYIAAIRPSIALMIDIRRDNLLEHLLFKSLFEMSRTRVEYLALLLGRPVPSNLDAWRGRSIQDIVEYLDHTPADSALAARTQAAINRLIASYHVPLTDLDRATIARIRGAFVSDSLSLRYSSLGRAPRPYHPTYRTLLLERDRAGRQASYLADEDGFQYVKMMEERGLVIPVVGNVAGDRALKEVSRFLTERGLVVSAFYLSNVEQYLMRDGSFGGFATNVAQLPRNGRSVIIRSFFGAPFGSGHPLNVPGHTSTQLLQTFDSLIADYEKGTLRSYFDLVGRNFLDP